LDDGSAVLLERDLASTASQFGSDAPNYRLLFEPIASRWPTLADEVLRPLRVPHHPFLLARFGLRAIQPATVLARRSFSNLRARALFAGLAAHSFLKLEAPLSGAFGLILGATGHAVGWPSPRGGAQRITTALGGILSSYGGRISTGSPVQTLDDLGSPDLVLCDVTPRQFLALADRRLSFAFRRLLERYRYGPGVFKMDWALREPIPWRAKECLRAGTVHLGGSLEEIAASERAAWQDAPPDKPFVLLSQPTLFDSTRAPQDKHTAWAYCHVPNGWKGSMLEAIEGQIERFAPGFRDCILARAAHNTEQMQQSNPNLIGGDINGGVADVTQFVLRPTWRRYGTPLPGIYLCSSSTPPGGGVHGMCGYWAARWALDWLKARA
jgi:phytoene dehydrogenase-like protein